MPQFSTLTYDTKTFTAPSIKITSVHLTPIEKSGSAPLQGQWECAESDSDRQKRNDLLGRAISFREQICRAEQAHRLSASQLRKKRMLLIGVAIVLVFFGLPGVIAAISLIVVMIYYKPLAQAVRHEVAAEICLVLSKELNALLDSMDNTHFIEGKLTALESLRAQLVRMQEDVLLEAYEEVVNNPNPLHR